MEQVLNGICPLQDRSGIQDEFDFNEDRPGNGFLGFTEFASYSQCDRVKMIDIFISARNAKREKAVSLLVAPEELPQENLAKRYLLHELASEHRLSNSRMCYTVERGLEITL